MGLASVAANVEQDHTAVPELSPSDLMPMLRSAVKAVPSTSLSLRVRSLVKRSAPLALLALLPACSTIFEGRSQEIMVNTNPDKASCVLVRHDETLGTIYPTPGSMYIEKTKYDLKITCDKPGYETATYLNHSGEDNAVFGNILLGGVVGWGVDSATGSDNKYTSPVNINLNPVRVPPADPMGLDTYRDNAGNVVRCLRDTLGNLTCK